MWRPSSVAGVLYNNTGQLIIIQYSTNIKIQYNKVQYYILQHSTAQQGFPFTISPTPFKFSMPCLHIDSTIEFSWINDIILHRTKLNADIVFNTTHHQPQVLKIPYRMWIWPWTTLSGQESSFQISLLDILPKLSTSLFKNAAQRNVVQSVCKQWVHLYF